MQFFLRTLVLASVALLNLGAPSALHADSGIITKRACPYNCSFAGISKSECRDWRIGDECYVEDLRSSRFKLCIVPGSDSIRMRRVCSAKLREVEVSWSGLKGEPGAQGEKGETGATGPAGAIGPTGPTGAIGSAGADGADGADGQLRIYGDGSAGAKSVGSSSTLNDSNPQYTNFLVQSGVTLTVNSGTVIRCTGTFQNLGTINVLPALRDHPRFGENGQNLNDPKSGGDEAPGGQGGAALPVSVAKGLLRLGLLGGGNGYREQGESGGDGGGNFTVLCLGAVANDGTINANGTNAAVLSRGGGAAGFVALASATSVTNNGTIHANGGNGGALRANDPTSTGHGPGGGGSGGIVHFIAPVIGSTGIITVDGGIGGSAGSPGAITAPVYIGGGGGGGAGGAGGDGGAVNPGNIGNDSTSSGEAGDNGEILQTLAVPNALF